ncbi:MAG TPA: hypothetical protein VFB55_08500, partial [Verrucomicrobiae bacterium]|nr:hypothetical protein [Verrucomicrobiae bacterium]
MADTPPNVPGASGPEPMKKTTGKVAPKKETVRITLPPKPSAAPTIKLPTLPPGGATGAPVGAGAAAPRPAAPPPAAAPSRATPAPRAAAPAAAQRPAPAPRVAAPAPAAGGLDQVLAIVAGVAALAAA